MQLILRLLIDIGSTLFISSRKSPPFSSVLKECFIAIFKESQNAANPSAP